MTTQNCPECLELVSGNSDESYWDGEGKYVCFSCGDKAISWFNRLVNDNAGYATSGDISVHLRDLISLQKMTEYDFDMMRYVINEKTRREVLRA